MSTATKTSVAILGVSGRMGRTLLTGIESSDSLKLSGALDSSDSRWINLDAGTLAGPSAAGVVITDDPKSAVRGAQVAINFTLPQATPSILAACIAAKCPLVLGTTGHDKDQLAAIDAAAKHIPLVMTSNF
ncbi:MAG TPA: hypothetical protein VK629_22155, partial [Steroidobacteraceae bacterium]|nr:hypothetical protein [Steroidobacteraceae bacterium]